MQNSFHDEKVDHIVCTQYFSWTPILIGALVGVGLGFLLDLFGKGIGLSLYTNDTNGATILAVGGFLALLFGGFITMFAAGFATGFFAGPRCSERNYGAVYGFVAWCLSLILVAWFSTGVVGSEYMKSDSRMFTPATQEMSATTERVTTRLHPATDANDTRAEKQVRATGMLSLATFIIFFIGALGASFGGYFGFYYWDKWETERKARL
ncbi:MAG: hypothetical protein H0W64_11455 [Gammaproteobacteria bacterium]|nr:hypothetical protein [Gammaproteobacteria bacterium]